MAFVVHNMMLAPVLHQKHQRDAGIELISIPASRVLVFVESNQSCRQILWMSRILFDKENTHDFSFDTHMTLT